MSDCLGKTVSGDQPDEFGSFKSWSASLFFKLSCLGANAMNFGGGAVTGSSFENVAVWE